MIDLAEELKKVGEVITPVLDFAKDDFMPVDLSENREGLSDIDLNDKEGFTDFIFQPLHNEHKKVAYGGYGEQRGLYSRSTLFNGSEPRSFHLGLDLWTKAGTEVFVPIAGKVHSWGNHARHGDYGPVIILEHQIAHLHFFSLYGHLSVTSLIGLEEGKSFHSGDCLGTIGRYEENFHWPPHLHFQLMADMEGLKGDYPGVCKPSEKKYYLGNTYDPLFLAGLE